MASETEGSLVIASLIHSRLFDLAEDAQIGDVEEMGSTAARFRISTPEDGIYTVWVAPHYPVVTQEGANVP